MKGSGFPHTCDVCLAIIVGAGLSLVQGCTSSFEQIDHQVDALMAQTNTDMGGDTLNPSITRWDLDASERQVRTEYDPVAEFIPTLNPYASDLKFIPSAEEDSEQVIARLDRYNEISENATHLDLSGTLAYAIKNSREYRFAEEEFVLNSLRLLIERHLWGPRFFDDMTAEIAGLGDAGLFDTSLNLVNEFRITQRLPYGGTVSATALARATENLHELVAGEETQSADIILTADIPLLRGAGTVAREDLIQTERNMIYSARSFERFRRNFLFDISQDFLDLVLQQRRLFNSEKSVESFELVEARQTARYQEGRINLFDAALAENATVDARDSLNSSREAYRFSVDRFKVRLGMPIEEDLIIDDSNLGLPIPEVGIDDAVRIAMTHRLDLQNERDRVADFKRGVDNARNDLLPDLDFDASIVIPTDPNKDRGGIGFDPGYLDFQTGVTFGLPLDREIERLSLRQSQINLERSRRSYDQFRDSVAIEVRAAVRGMDTAMFSLQIQQRGIDIAIQRQESIKAAPERATPRDMTEAVDQLRLSQDDRDRAARNLEVSILRYLLDSGQLRVAADGSILPLQGMEITHSDPEPRPDDPDSAVPSDTDDPGESGEGAVGTK